MTAISMILNHKMDQIRSAHISIMQEIFNWSIGVVECAEHIGTNIRTLIYSFADD